MTRQSKVSNDPIANSLLAQGALPGQLRPQLEKLGVSTDEVAIVVVDHGSRRQASNDLLLQVAAALKAACGLEIVEPAHMELAEPSIQSAFDRAVARGARLIVVHPYFLSPGRHWHQDIPQLAAEAAKKHDGIRYLVTSPLGLHPLMLQIIQYRVQQCLHHAVDGGENCDVCDDQGGCQIRPSRDSEDGH